MAPVITNLAPMTETQAVNLMLRQIGEQPVADASASALADVGMALDILRETAAESLSEKYSFNTTFNLRINPTTTFTFTDADGTTVLLNIFKPPVGLLGFSVTQNRQQQNPRLLDLEIMPSRQYVETALPVQVFYDREHNRDGLPASLFSYISVDPTWYVDFEKMPQEARRYIAIRAARIFTENVPGSGALAKFTSDDELVALRQLKRRYGIVETVNIFDNAQNAAALGLPFRRFNASGVRDLRTNP